MKNYKQLIMTAPCDFCATRLRESAIRVAYRKAANKAVDQLLVYWGDQQAGRFVHLDGNVIAALVDDLLSIENDDTGSNGGIA